MVPSALPIVIAFSLSLTLRQQRPVTALLTSSPIPNTIPLSTEDSLHRYGRKPSFIRNDILSINGRLSGGTYRTQSGDYLLEGDILIPAGLVNDTTGSPYQKGPLRGGICTRRCGRWPYDETRGKYVVPYRFPTGEGSESYTPKVKNLIKWVHLHIEVNSNIKFLERTNETSYVQYVDEAFCYTEGVGDTGDAKKVSLGYFCFDIPTVLHELFHVLGLYHEHQRMDRDKYITIEWNKVNERSKSQLTIREDDETKYFTPYDYASIMHYSIYSGGDYRTPTMTLPEGPNKERYVSMIQREDITGSLCDWAEIAHMYPGANPGPKCEPHRPLDPDLCVPNKEDSRCLEDMDWCKDLCFMRCGEGLSLEACILTASYGNALDFNFAGGTIAPADNRTMLKSTLPTSSTRSAPNWSTSTSNKSRQQKLAVALMLPCAVSLSSLLVWCNAGIPLTQLMVSL